MRICVTGGAGSIGPFLTAELKRRGHDAYPYDIKLSPAMDVTAPFDLVNTDVLYHLAADKHAPDGEVHPYSTQRVNIEGTRNALKSGARVILASTCKAAVPETVYGASKLIAERMVLNAGGTVGRLYNVETSARNVFEIWADQVKRYGTISVAPCWRYFVTLETAVSFLADLLDVEPGRYVPRMDAGAKQSMLDVAAQWCTRQHLIPDATIRMTPPRRGDRVAEPLHGPHERYERVPGTAYARIVSPHDSEVAALVESAA